MLEVLPKCNALY